MFPFASSLHARRCCVFRNIAKLPRSKASLHSRAARERGRTFFRGVANNTPYYGCCTHSGLPSESKARSFSQKLNVVHASLRERGLLSASATWSIRPLEKSMASYIFVYIYIAVLAYYSLYLLLAIRLYIFFYIYISVSVSYVQPQFFSIGCAVNHHQSFLTCKGMAAQADTKHQSMLSLSAKIFCSRLPQSEIGYSTKNLYRLFGLLPYWTAIF